MKYDIVALGESLIDFVETETDEAISFSGRPGGAPLNVLACCTKLGLKSAFIGKIGRDGIGQFLVNAIEKTGILTEGIVFSDYPTTLAFVSLNDEGDRSFSFYRSKTSDIMLTATDVDKSIISSCKVFHFGSLSTTNEPAYTATMSSAKYAKDCGAIISSDPNLRKKLWGSMEVARVRILESFKIADFVKISEEELYFISGNRDKEFAMRELKEHYKLKLLVVTMGEKGCVCLCNDKLYNSSSYAVKCIDATGAGDAFWGAVLSSIIKNKKAAHELTGQEIMHILDFSNATGALSTTRYGAIPSLPNINEIERCLASNPRIMS